MFITQTFPCHLSTFTPSQRYHYILPQLSIDDSHHPLMSEGLSKANHNSFTKIAHFVPTTEKTTAEGLARLFRDNVWRLHGLPESIISDRGP